MVSDIKTVPGFVLRDYWIAGNITDEEYRVENDRRYAQQKLERDALITVKDYRAILSEARAYIRLLIGDEYSVVVRNIDTVLGDNPTPAPILSGGDE